MKYIRKTTDEFEIQGYYRPYGWECLTTEDRFIDALVQIKSYQDNAPTTTYRIIKKRVKVQP